MKNNRAARIPPAILVAWLGLFAELTSAESDVALDVLPEVLILTAVDEGFAIMDAEWLDRVCAIEGTEEVDDNVRVLMLEAEFELVILNRESMK